MSFFMALKFWLTGLSSAFSQSYGSHNGRAILLRHINVAPVHRSIAHCFIVHFQFYAIFAPRSLNQIEKLIKKGGGIGPVKPWQPLQLREGAKSYLA
jgi:hypothetical protein